MNVKRRNISQVTEVEDVSLFKKAITVEATWEEKYLMELLHMACINSENPLLDVSKKFMKNFISLEKDTPQDVGVKHQVSAHVVLQEKGTSQNVDVKNQDDLLDVIYWMRQIFALINGIAWGLIPLQGVSGLGLFLAINCFIVYIYALKFQKVDEDDYGGLQELIKEGLFTAFAVFLVSWIMVYTGVHASK